MTKIKGSHEVIGDITYNLQDCQLSGSTYKCTGIFSTTYIRDENLSHWIFKIKPGSNKIDYFSFENDKIDLRPFKYSCDDIIQTITQPSTELKTHDELFKISLNKLFGPLDCDIFLFSNSHILISGQNDELI